MQTRYAPLHRVLKSVCETKAMRYREDEGGRERMAIYQLSVKPIRRSEGGNAKAAAAYRSGTKIGKYDYTRRRGVADGFLLLPPAAPKWTRAELWEEAEKAEKRKNSVVAREVLLALPHEMPLEGHRKAIEKFCGWLVARYQCAADAAIHTPKRGHDERNHHAHILMTTRRISAQGMNEKTRELDDNRTTGPREIEAIRATWAEILKGFGFDLEYQKKPSFPCSTGIRPIPPSRPAFPVRPNGAAVKGARSEAKRGNGATRSHAQPL